MTQPQTQTCPECLRDDAQQDSVDRRRFIRVLGAGAAAAGSSALFSSRRASAEPAAEATPKQAKPAEDLIRELYATLTAEQKQELVLPFDHGGGGGMQPSRLRTYNSAILGRRIGQKYSKPQQELVQRILRSILSGDEAYERITRHGKWDGSRSFEGNGAVLFGDPTKGERFSWVFAGHHLTVRCDGNSQPGAAFGGPMYYGHSANGYSENNVYFYQTKQVRSVFDALNDKQRQQAVIVGNPGDRERGIRFRPADDPVPGVVYADLNTEQQKLVQTVMRTLLEPFRKEDGDEVMELLRANGGLEEIHLAFFKDAPEGDDARWHFWRLEGPGFIWNYRVLPHVHCYVNIVDV
jgi:hypothetical protein